MNFFFGFLCIAVGVAMLALPAFGNGFVKFQNDLRGNKTSDDTGLAVSVQAVVWVVVGIVLMIAL